MQREIRLPQEAENLAQCPFWRDNTRQRQIRCEGITRHSIIVQHFRSLQEWQQQKQIFCCEHYKNCELYRAIMETKYAEELE